MAHIRKTKLIISTVGLLLLVLATALSNLPQAYANAPERAGTPRAIAQKQLNQPVFDVEALPQDLDSIIVTWKTRKPSRGAVLFGLSPENMTEQVAEDQSGNTRVKHHRVLIQGLNPGTVYYFVVSTDDARYDNRGAAFKVRTNVSKEQPDQRAPATVGNGSSILAAPSNAHVDHPTGIVAEATETSFSVVWQTRKAKAGWINYGTSPESLTLRADDERGRNSVASYHRVIVKDLVPGIVYYFTVVVDDISYDNGGAAFKVHVGRSLLDAQAAQTDATTQQVKADTSALPTALAAELGGAPFVYPTAGYMGEPYTSAHNGLDIWTSDPNSAPCGNEIRAAFRGKVKRIWKSTTFDGYGWASAARGEADASIVVLEHTDPVPGLPSPFYTYYLHMAKDAGGTSRGPASATCVYLSTWDKLASGEQIPAGFPLGRQGDLRLEGDRITHLHFSIATSDLNMFTTYNPASYLGLSLQRGNALLYTGQTINLRLASNIEQDTIYFNADQGQIATLSMVRQATSLDGYLYLYAPNGTLVAQDDDSGGNYNPLINRVTLPQTGSYRVVSASYAGSSSGGYSLGLTLDTPTASCTPGANGVVLYEHPNYAGRCVTLTGDQADFTSAAINFNDIASSLRFVGSYASGWEAVVYEHTYYGGGSSTFRASDADFGNDTIGHDRASSIRIRQFDPDDGRIISTGQTLGGQINPTTDQDTYYFNGTQGQIATLSMVRQATSLDGYLYLYAPNGTLVAQDDDSGGNYNPLINRVTLPQTGSYRVVSASYAGSSSGGYSLGLTLDTPTASCTPGANGVVLYEHPNYAGRCVTLTGDQADFTSAAINFNDIASSLRFVGSYASGWEAVVYEHTYYGGGSSTFRASDADFGNDTIGHDRASSIRIRQVSSEVIVDEQSAGFTKGGSYWQDDWSRGYNGHMYWTCVNGSVVDSWGEWRPNLPAARSYELYAFVPDYHTNTSNARYEIHYANGVTTVARAQQSYSNVWVSLGIFSFGSGTAGYVRLTDATGEAASCTTQIGFDALKWVPR